MPVTAIAKSCGSECSDIRLVLSHRAEGMSVETTPSPAARYSRVFSGKLALLKADSAYGVMPTP